MSRRDSKKEAILLAGMEVMKAHGYNGTSVKDIVEAAGVPKGSFYNYFESKEQFAIEAIDYAAAEGHEFLARALGDSSKCAVARLSGFFSSSIDCACDSKFKVGCFLGNMCQEMSDTSDAIRARLDKVLEGNTRLIADVIEQGQERESIGRDLDPKLASEFLFNAWQGALMRAKAAKSRAPLDAFMAMLGKTLV